MLGQTDKRLLPTGAGDRRSQGQLPPLPTQSHYGKFPLLTLL